MARRPIDPRLAAIGVTDYNVPKRTPGHPTKSHVVVAKEGDQIKTIRFGEQGVKGNPPKDTESPEYKARRIAFYRRHEADIKKGKMSAAWWAYRVKWGNYPT